MLCRLDPVGLRWSTSLGDQKCLFHEIMMKDTRAPGISSDECLPGAEFLVVQPWLGLFCRANLGPFWWRNMFKMYGYAVFRSRSCNQQPKGSHSWVISPWILMLQIFNLVRFPLWFGRSPWFSSTIPKLRQGPQSPESPGWMRSTSTSCWVAAGPPTIARGWRAPCIASRATWTPPMAPSCPGARAGLGGRGIHKRQLTM